MSSALPAEIEIRVALPDDCAALMRAIEIIDSEADFLGRRDERLEGTDDPAALRGTLQEITNAVFVLALVGGAIVAYARAVAGELRSTRGVASVVPIGVRRAYRRRGIGTLLLRALEMWALMRGSYRLDLLVHEANTAAIAFYRRAGFTIEGRIVEGMQLHGSWHSLLPMAKLLTPPPAASEWAPPAAPPRRITAPVVFRPLRNDDAQAVRDWELRLLAEPPDWLKSCDEVAPVAAIAAELTARLSNRLHFAMAAVVRQGAHECIVGLLSVSGRAEPSLRGDRVFSINVLRDHRGTGIGRRLAEYGELWVQASGAHRLSAMVHASNRDGLRFAEALGFIQEAVMRRCGLVGGQSVDLVRLGRLLGVRTAALRRSV